MLPASLKTLHFEAIVYDFSTKRLPSSLTELHVPMVSLDGESSEELEEDVAASQMLDFSNLPDLEVLTMDQLLFPLAAPTLSPTITRLHLLLDTWDTDYLSISLVQAMPPNLTYLAFTHSNTSNTVDLFRALPRQLRHLEINFPEEELIGRQELAYLPLNLSRLKSRNLLLYHCVEFLPPTLNKLKVYSDMHSPERYAMRLDKDIPNIVLNSVCRPVTSPLTCLTLQNARIDSSKQILPDTITRLNIGAIVFGGHEPKIPKFLTHLTTTFEAHTPFHPRLVTTESIEHQVEARRNGILPMLLPKTLQVLNIVLRSAVSVALILPEGLTRLTLVDLCDVGQRPEGSSILFPSGWSALLPRKLEHLKLRISHHFLNDAWASHMNHMIHLRSLEIEHFTRTTGGLSVSNLLQLPVSLEHLSTRVSEPIAWDRVSMRVFVRLKKLNLVGPAPSVIGHDFVDRLPPSLRDCHIPMSVGNSGSNLSHSIAQVFQQRHVSFRATVE
jgi:hypothetical protein